MDIFDPNILFNDDEEDKHIEPDRIFSSLLKEPEYEYLRGVQIEILDQWFDKRNEKDTILKMNTGAGKTLVGLLMLQSSINEGEGPAVYLCPDYQLVNQVLGKSEKYGINCVTFNKQENFPQEFLNSDSILVTVFDKVFNGKSRFEKHGIEIGTILLDDAHTCINRTRDKFSLKISINSNIYSKLLEIFEPALKKQDIGSYSMIQQRDPATIMQVPFWTWMDNIDEISNIISEEAKKNLGEDEDSLNLIFSWPLLSKNIESCYCLISGENIEISPYCIPIKEISSFYNAKRRIFMSATLLDDSLLIKELDISKQAILNPLKNKMYYNIGERMILLPSLLHSSLNNDTIPNICKDISLEGNNTIVITPSFSSSRIKKWRKIGATIAKRDNIDECIHKLSSSNENIIVLANRYDGIDLKGEQCRLLILDGLPTGTSMYEKYINYVRPNSRILKSIQAQKIEQGIGRSTRSSNDYCVVIIMNPDLVTFLSVHDNKNHLSPQTRKQVEIGLSFGKKVDFSEENASESLKALTEASYERNKNWIKFHNSQIQKSNKEIIKNLPIEIAETERDAYDLFNSNRALEAEVAIQNCLNKNLEDLHPNDIGWFLQLAATYLYKENKTRSMEIQLKAHEQNTYINKVPSGIKYKKLDKHLGVQPNRISDFIKEFDEPNALLLYVNNLLNKLRMGVKHDIFEENLVLLGEYLGFEAHRPEKEYGKGPDVLWHMTNNEYVMYEAKNEVKEDRGKIYKSEVSQMSNSINWFKKEYTGKTGCFILIHPSLQCEEDAYPDKEMKVMNTEKLDQLKVNTGKFTTEIINKFTVDVSVKEIGELLHTYKLTPTLIKNTYFKRYIK